MGIAEDYVKAHEAISNVVEESFRKMARHCEFNKEKPVTDKYVQFNKIECHCPNGDNSGVCAREICPVLEEE